MMPLSFISTSRICSFQYSYQNSYQHSYPSHRRGKTALAPSPALGGICHQLPLLLREGTCTTGCPALPMYQPLALPQGRNSTQRVSENDNFKEEWLKIHDHLGDDKIARSSSDNDR